MKIIIDYKMSCEHHLKVFEIFEAVGILTNP